MTWIGEPTDVAVAGTPATSSLPAAAVAQTPMLDLEVHPALAAGRRARYTAVLVNRGSTEIEAWLSVDPGEAGLRCVVIPPRMLIAPGQARQAEVRLRPRRPQLVRGERQHDAQIRVSGQDGPVAAVRRVIFVQQRALPLWLLAPLAVLVAAAAFALTLAPKHATVPSVQGAADVATAERALHAAGLQLDPQLRSRTTTSARPGTILDQIPDPGTRVDRGSRVTLLVAIGSTRAVTPSLDGQTPARAAQILRAAGLAAGPVLPDGAPSASVVASQLPVAGARVPAGTAVTVIVRPARAGASTAPGGAAPSAGTAASTGRAAKVPAIGGRSVTAYARAVAAAGLVPRIVRQVGTQPIGTLLTAQPAAGTALRSGDRVRLLVSAGVPQLAFDTGSVLRVFDPTRGKTVREAAPPQGTAVEPSWSPDGRRLLYRVGTRLLLVSARLADRGRVVYDGTAKYAAATFAPAPADNVIALVRRTGDDGDLCFARVGAGMLRPRCAADPRWDLGREISWRAGGRELLVFGVRRGQPGRFGILRYTSARAFSTNPADWHGQIVTDTSVSGQGVIAAAYSPSGTSVALVSNVGLPRFQLRIAGAGDLRTATSLPLPVRACEVAWRPDGRELAVVQSDDTCSRAVGEIVRLDPQHPRTTTTVSSGGRHPAYQPLTYTGPKGVS
ncbi:MAG TPA: PASTA domain-containing protein [Solirubrobacteraceae bacterium]|jgi:beta-lactam-binding protein with PASTA domain